MLSDTWLPYALSIGISEEKFWTLNPHTIKPYTKAFTMCQERKDIDMWRMGIYVQSAVTVAVDHCLNGKKARSEYISEAILVTHNKEIQAEVSKKERIKNAEKIFSVLEIMKINFEIEQQNKKAEV